MTASDPSAKAIRRPRWMLILCLGIVYVVWGSTYLAIRVMVETVPPMLGAGARFLAAGCLLAVVLLGRDGRAFAPVLLREARGAALAGLLILVGGIGLVTIAETDVPSALTALIIASVPLFVVVLRMLHGDKVAPRTVAAVGVGFVGVGLLLLPGGDASGGRLGPMLLVVLAALLTALGAFYSKRLATPRNMFVATLIEMLVAGCVLLLGSALLGETSEFRSTDLSTASLVAFIYLVTVGSLVAYSAFVWLLGNASVSTVATYAYVNPVVALILGAAILGESITLTTLLAACTIVASVVVVVKVESGRS